MEPENTPPWKRKIIWTKPSCSGSMLIFGGVSFIIQGTSFTCSNHLQQLLWIVTGLGPVIYGQNPGEICEIGYCTAQLYRDYNKAIIRISIWTNQTNQYNSMSCGFWTVPFFVLNTIAFDDKNRKQMKNGCILLLFLPPRTGIWSIQGWFQTSWS